MEGGSTTRPSHWSPLTARIDFPRSVCCSPAATTVPALLTRPLRFGASAMGTDHRPSSSSAAAAAESMAPFAHAATVCITRMQVTAADDCTRDDSSHSSSRSSSSSRAQPSQSPLRRVAPCFLLVLLLSVLLQHPVCGLSLTQVSLRTQLIALESSGAIAALAPSLAAATTAAAESSDALTASSPGGGGVASAAAHRSSSPPPPPPPLLVGAKIAVLSLRFDGDVRVRQRGVNSTGQEEAAAVPLTELQHLSQLYGSARLICGSNLFDSHPPSSASTEVSGGFAHAAMKTEGPQDVPALLPSFMLLTPQGAPGVWAEQFPLLAMLDAQEAAEPLAGDDEESEDASSSPSRSLRAFIVLSASFATTNDAAPSWRHFVDASNLRRCQMRLPSLSSQSWQRGKGVELVGKDGRVAMETSVPVLPRRVSAIKRAQRGSEDLPLLASVPLPSSVVRNLLRSAMRTEVQRSIALAASSTPAPSAFLQTSSGSGEVSSVGSDIAGQMKGLIKAVLKGLGKPMGNQIGAFTADGILDPVAEKVLDGIRDGVQAGLSDYATGDVVVQMIPGVCETVTAAVTESTATAIANEVVRGTTETITTDVVTRTTYTVADPLTFKSAQTISVKLARTLHNNLAHMLSRSIPHIIVPALLNTVSVGVKEDYYCYFCAARQIYCMYCNKNRGDTINRLYYALYYTGQNTRTKPATAAAHTPKHKHEPPAAWWPFSVWSVLELTLVFYVAPCSAPLASRSPFLSLSLSLLALRLSWSVSRSAHHQATIPPTIPIGTPPSRTSVCSSCRSG